MPYTIIEYTIKTAPKEIIERAVNIFASSFCGTLSTIPECSQDWAYGFDRENRSSNDLYTPLESGPNERRKEWFHFCMLFAVHIGLRKNGTLAIVVEGKEKEDHITPEDVMGVMVYVPPTEPPLNWFSKVWQQVTKKVLPLVVFFADVQKKPPFDDASNKRNTTLLNLLESEHDKVNRPHYYLQTLGVSPESQGRGVGKALLNHLCGKADQEGMEIYLEASGERNRIVYSKSGFDVVSKVIVKSIDGVYPDFDLDGGESIMIRQPQSIDAHQ